MTMRLRLLLLLVDLALAEYYVTWKVPQFSWPSKEAKERALKSKEYIPENNIVWKTSSWRLRMFLSIPRWNKGIPATLAEIQWPPELWTRSPILNPYPSWNFQKEGNCTVLQSVPGTAIDPRGKLWVLDAGNKEAGCAPKLVVFDLRRNTEIFRVDLSEVVTEKSTLQGIELDILGPRGPQAFISDFGGNGLIIYTFREDFLWRLDHPLMKDAMFDISLVPFMGRDDFLYFTSYKTHDLFSIETKFLRSANGPFDMDPSAVVRIGEKLGPSSGLAADVKGGVYYFYLWDHVVVRWDTKEPIKAETHFICLQNATVLPAVSQIVVDNFRQVWAMASTYHPFYEGFMGEPNGTFFMVNVYKIP